MTVKVPLNLQPLSSDAFPSKKCLLSNSIILFFYVAAASKPKTYYSVARILFRLLHLPGSRSEKIVSFFYFGTCFTVIGIYVSTIFFTLLLLEFGGFICSIIFPLRGYFLFTIMNCVGRFLNAWLINIVAND